MLGFNLGTLCEARLRRRFKSDPRNDRINKNTNIKHLQRTSARHAVRRSTLEASSRRKQAVCDLRVEPSEPRGQSTRSRIRITLNEAAGVAAQVPREVDRYPIGGWRRTLRPPISFSWVVEKGGTAAPGRSRIDSADTGGCGAARRRGARARARFIRGTKCVVVTALYPPWERVYTSALIYRQRRARLGYG